MNRPFKDYYINSDINKTLENIYSSEQIPFKISFQLEVTNHIYFIQGLITNDTDYKDFRREVLDTFPKFIESHGLDFVMLRAYFRVYRLT